MLEYAKPLVHARVGRNHTERSCVEYYIPTQARKCGMDVQVVQEGKCTIINVEVAATMFIIEL